MTDAVEYVRAHRESFADYAYLQQFEPDAEGLQFNDQIAFDRMREVYDLEPVWGGIAGERQMRSYLETDLMEGTIAPETFARGLDRTEFNDLQNYHAWNTYDTLALRATEGESEIIPRQEYEFLSTCYAALRWPEFFKVLLDTIGLEGIMDAAAKGRDELGSGMTSGLGWCFVVVPGFGTISLDILGQLDPADPAHVEQRKTYLTVGAAVESAVRGHDGCLLPSQNRYVNDIKSEETLRFVTDNLVDLEGSTKSNFRQFNAAAEMLSFLMHYDNRVGLVDNGPYLVEDGKPMILRDVLLNRPFLPWSDITDTRDLPYAATIAFVIDPDEMGLQEIRCPITTFTAPADHLAAAESGAVFLRETPEQTEPLPLDALAVPDLDDDLPDLTARANDGVTEWYERMAELSRREKIMNGGRTYFIGMLVPLLRATGTYEYFTEEMDLWELPPMVSDAYYRAMGDVATEQVPAQIMFGYGWSDFPESPNESSGYADYLERATEMGWQSDLTGMNEVPDYWAERMDEYGHLEVPHTKMAGDVDRAELGEYLAGLD